MPQPQQLTIKQAISQAKKATKQGNTAVAIELYNAVLLHQPNHPVAKKGLRKLQNGLPKDQFVKVDTANPSQDQINALVNLYHSGQMAEAEQACRELLQTYQQSLVVINILGAVLLGQGKLQDAIESYDKAIQIKPDFAEAYSNRGIALKEIGQLDEAVESYDKAIQIKPDFADAYSNRGNALKELGRLDEAVTSCDKAIQIKPDFADAYGNRGNALQAQGLLDEAVVSYDKAIQINPDDAKAYRNLSTMKKYKPGDHQIVVMKNLYATEKLSESNRVHLSFALAKAYDDIGEYGKAFNYLVEGNRLRKKELNYNIDTDKRLIAKILSIFSAESQSPDIVEDRNRSIQPIFILGMPRSGTSLVEQILASHSKVHGAGELDTMNKLVIPLLSTVYSQNINQDTCGISRSEINTVRDSYLEALTVLKVPEKIITDKMPLNFRWIGFILSAFPEAKILHINRDSRATCWSIYKHYFSSNGNGYAYDLLDLADFYKLYIDLMSFWRKRFPNSIYDLCYEDLTKNQEEETRKLLYFCDLEWEKECLDFHETKRAVTTASTVQIRKKMYKGSSEAWRKYEEYLQPLIKAIN